MRIARITAYLLHLPLRQEIKHASATRSESTNVLVCCRLGDGTQGWGEGVPRSYVTGETPGGAIVQLQATSVVDQLSVDCQDWPDVLRMCDSLQLASMQEDPRGCYGNALRCGIELSVMDAYGNLFGDPLSRITAHFAPARSISTRLSTVRYSGAVTAASGRKEAVSAMKMRAYGFQDCKVKVGTVEDEPRRLRRLRRWLGYRITVRIDANEAWPADIAAERIASLAPFDIASVEQPVAHAEVGALADVRRQVSVPIMLDESLTSLADAKAAIENRTCDLFNIRLSKCGGFLNSLRLAALAHDAGLGYQMGCHPGESGILSAAGRHWATTVAGIRFCEGSYDRHLLRRLVTNEDITFGYGGRAPAITRAGLGVTINPAALSDLAEPRADIRF